MGLVLNGTTGITNLPSINSGQIGGRRNIVINGEMKVAQRSTSVTGLGAAAGYFTLDRFSIATAASAGRFTMAQIADGPAGIANCLKITTTTADTSIAAGEYLILGQPIEGQDLQQLKKGTATAEQVTVSFYVKGNAAALYVCELFDTDNSRSITQSFAVTTAWNRIELTFAADTSDPLDDDTAASLVVNFWLHGGATYTGGTFAVNTWNDQTAANRYAVADRTSIFDATSRTFFITGVQMELGATATDLESRSFCEELALCQRYYCKTYDYGIVPGTNGATDVNAKRGTVFVYRQRDTNYVAFSFFHPVAMRAVPTMTNYSHAGTSGKFTSSTSDTTISTNAALSGTKLSMAYGVGTADDAYGHFVCEAEL